jgi:hypothetical protein
MNAPALANTGPGRCGQAELEELELQLLFLIGQFYAARPLGRLKPRCRGPKL